MSGSILPSKMCIKVWDSFSHTELTHSRTQTAQAKTLGFQHNLLGLGAWDRDRGQGFRQGQGLQFSHKNNLLGFGGRGQGGGLGGTGTGLGGTGAWDRDRL